MIRDYIGSADAHAIYRENNSSLIRSKLADNQHLSTEMSRGLMLEKDILLQAAALEGAAEISLQWSPDDKFKYPYCNCTVDGLFHFAKKKTPEIREAKSSKYPSPKNEEELLRNYPRYYTQVQFQMWRTGFKKNLKVVWCHIPEDTPAFDDDGQLDITLIPVKWNPLSGKVFEKNCPVFWDLWEKAKNPSEADVDLTSLVDMGSVIELERQVEATVLELAKQKEQLSETRKAILEAMEANGIVTYETDAIRIAYVAPTTKTSVDTAALKRSGMYETYTKTSPVKANIRVTLKSV